MGATVTPLRPSAPVAVRPAPSGKASFVKWLRKTHGWIGLWGAVLGLIFGGSGILLNHRALLKIPAVQTQESSIELPLPAPAPRDAEAMAQWLRQTLQLANPASRVRSEKARPVAWGDASLLQPARWSAAFVTPSSNLQAEYWVGNSYVSIKRSDSNLFGMLTNLHKGNGMGVAWVLLVDSLAGSIILLSLSGVLLWALTNKKRLVGASIGALSLLTLAAVAAVSL